MKLEISGCDTDGSCWFVMREKYCWLVAGGWFVVREKYCWLVADKPKQQGVWGWESREREKHPTSPARDSNSVFSRVTPGAAASPPAGGERGWVGGPEQSWGEGTERYGRRVVFPVRALTRLCYKNTLSQVPWKRTKEPWVLATLVDWLTDNSI
jgi:hypothetical protein